MTPSIAQLKTFVFLTATALLCSANCTKVAHFVESSDLYHTEIYKKVCNTWSREARIHSGLQVELIVSATFKSAEFRRAYANEYAKAYKLTPEEKQRLLEDQLKAASYGHEFLMASFVPEKKWDDFDKFESMWKLYLTNDTNDRVVPVEVRKAKQKDAVAAHFFPHVTPWKSIYTVRFPCNIPATNEAIVGDNTREIKLVITSVLGSAEMSWKLR